jgi:hypothetical protein
MNKESKFIRKIKRLLKRLGMPRWLHRYGPKIYEFLEHFYALILRHYCRLSYRRVRNLLDNLGFRCPSKSALQATAAKLGTSFWDKILKATSGQPYLLAIDSTGFSRSNPSYHYLRRIDGGIPKIPVKASIAFDTRRKKVVAARIRVLPAHDIKDVKTLLKKSNPAVFVADKAYDAAWLHEFCRDENIKAHIPIRDFGKPRFHRWDARQIATKHFRSKSYHRRELAESGNHSIKQTMGASVSSKRARTIRSELFGRLACYNLFYWIFGDSGQTRVLHLFFWV